MKTIAITSKTSMNVPTTAFTMKQLQAANPDVKYPTLNARLIQLTKSGEIIEKGSIKTDTGRGRAALLYAVPEASDQSNIVRQAKKQGRLIPVVSVKSVDPVVDTVTVPVEVVDTSESVTTV